MNKKLTRSIVCAVVASLGLVGVSVLPACNTVEGAGEDVQSAGRGVSGAAQKTQEEVFHNDSNY